MRLSGKKVIVTAAAQGIGRAAAIAFAKEGAEVIATDFSWEDLIKLSEVKGISIRKLNVLKKAEIDAISEEVGRVDILFNVEVFEHHGTVLDCTEEALDFSMEVNVKSMFRMIQAFLPSMLSHGKGNIINISSVAAVKKGVAVRCAYQTTKAAVVGLTKSVAADFCSKGIRCNCIMSGTDDTPSLLGRITSNSKMDPNASMKMVQDRSPVGRFGSADDIANLAVYLASDESDYVNGTEMIIDGCWSL